MPRPSRHACAACWSVRPPEVAGPAGADLRIEPGLTLEAAARRLRTWLSTLGADPDLEARVLLEEATGLDRAALLRQGSRELGDVAARRLEAWLSRRRTGEPLWRVIGTREFYGLPFAITPAVLDPRPDTETVVEAALAAMAGRGEDDLHVLDLGIGSGALLGALLHAWPNSRGWGVDLSFPACRVAAANLAALSLGSRAQVVNGCWAAALPDACFDVIVSNPPYIETAVIGTLDRAVRDHDPHLALDGGPDGLAAYRIIAARLPRLLRPGGVAALEVGAGQAADLTALLRAAGFASPVVRRDLAGVERVVAVRS